jgi:hypothetical protein
MTSIQSQLAAAAAEQTRIETVVWERNPGVIQDPRLLPILMTEAECKRWNAIEIAEEEVHKHLPDAQLLAGPNSELGLPSFE